MNRRAFAGATLAALSTVLGITDPAAAQTKWNLPAASAGAVAVDVGIG